MKKPLHKHLTHCPSGSTPGALSSGRLSIPQQKNAINSTGAPPVYRPDSLKAGTSILLKTVDHGQSNRAAPPVYKPQHTNAAGPVISPNAGSGAKLSRPIPAAYPDNAANSAILRNVVKSTHPEPYARETRPAPPVYKPNLGTPLAQLKPNAQNADGRRFLTPQVPGRPKKPVFTTCPPPCRPRAAVEIQTAKSMVRRTQIPGDRLQQPRPKVAQCRLAIVQRMSVEEWKQLAPKVGVWLQQRPNRQALMTRYDADDGRSGAPRSVSDLKWPASWSGERSSAFQDFMHTVSVDKFNEYVEAVKQAAAAKRESVRSGSSSSVGLSQSFSSLGGPLPIRPIKICLMTPYLYSGNDFEGPGYKASSKIISSQTIMKGDYGDIAAYLERLRQGSAFRFMTRISVNQKSVSANTKDVTEALLNEIEAGAKEITLVPDRVRSRDISGQLAEALSRVPGPLHHISGAQAAELDAMHARRFEEERPEARVKPLYHSDILVREIAADLGGDPTSVEELIEVNRIIQTSGINMELAADTSAKAGKIRTKNVMVSAGMRLAKVEDDLEQLLTAFVEDYNRHIVAIRPCITPGEVRVAFRRAVEMHQKFVQIHPFNNGNGRVARVLFYNILLAANIPPFSIDPKDSNYMALSGLHISGQASVNRMATYLMSQHLHALQTSL